VFLHVLSTVIQNACVTHSHLAVKSTARPIGCLPITSLVFYELDTSYFLSPHMKEALKQLLNIWVDLVSRHTEQVGTKYARQILLRYNLVKWFMYVLQISFPSTAEK
jgi:hypothetical protein